MVRTVVELSSLTIASSAPELIHTSGMRRGVGLEVGQDQRVILTRASAREAAVSGAQLAVAAAVAVMVAVVVLLVAVILLVVQ